MTAASLKCNFHTSLVSQHCVFPLTILAVECLFWRKAAGEGRRGTARAVVCREHPKSGTERERRRREGIHGGEMRRVDIGLQRVASPDLLMSEEPVSGEHHHNPVVTSDLSAEVRILCLRSK